MADTFRVIPLSSLCSGARLVAMAPRTPIVAMSCAFMVGEKSWTSLSWGVLGWGGLTKSGERTEQIGRGVDEEFNWAVGRDGCSSADGRMERRMGKQGQIQDASGLIRIQCCRSFLSALMGWSQCIPWQ